MTIDQLNKLTDEEVRVRVALALGMCAHPIEAWQREGTEGDMELVCNKCGKSLRDARIPNYPADLNAMHEAEKTLTPDQVVSYIKELEQAVRREENQKFGDPIESRFPLNEFGRFAVASSTARQRAIAFLAVTQREEG